ncbi:hypothetical protein XELAEV_18045271mg [Xenopus laevis]|uniref:Uncharacterized protein n=1 Tax=Xenopus laevis TaxID=8355 RepID=A0A974C135_XENLA|nr:hypothetical protein XELAEV_18045271mg [Xenopus laevis]
MDKYILVTVDVSSLYTNIQYEQGLLSNFVIESVHLKHNYSFYAGSFYNQMNVGDSGCCRLYSHMIIAARDPKGRTPWVILSAIASVPTR